MRETDIPTLPPITAICASGFVGTHPLDAASWSGSSRFFFGEIQKRGSLHACIGGEVPKLKKILLALRNTPIPPSKKIMIERMYMSTAYRNSLSRTLASKTEATEFPRGSTSVQLGSMYNLFGKFPSHVLRTSYNDGNLIQAINSPFYVQSNYSTRSIDQSIAYEKKVVHSLDIVFTMSEFLRQSFIHDYNVPEEKVCCIGAGINITPDLVDELLARDLSQKDYDRPFILFVAKDFRRKGGETVLKAFKKVQSTIPKAEIHFVGEIPDNLGSISPGKGVFFEGFLDKENPRHVEKFKWLFLRSTLYVLPAFHEAFGISPLEAMLNGIPCIVSNRWALKEIVPAGQVGENVKPGNTEELAEKMIALLSNPDKLRAYGERARPWVAENFLWDKVVDRLAIRLAGKRIS